MKRARSGKDQLTGGTQDVNPQYLSGRITLSAANTLTEQGIVTPIVRVGPQTDGQAIIMEILKIWVDFPAADAAVAAQTNRSQLFSVNTGPTAATPVVRTFGDPQCIARLNKNLTNAFTAAGTGVLEDSFEPTCFDLTDGAGHGVLVAVDTLYIQAQTTNQAAASTFEWKILYRFKRVSLVEFIGLVQSQQ